MEAIFPKHNISQLMRIPIGGCFFYFFLIFFSRCIAGDKNKIGVLGCTRKGCPAGTLANLLKYSSLVDILRKESISIKHSCTSHITYFSKNSYIKRNTLDSPKNVNLSSSDSLFLFIILCSPERFLLERKARF